MSAGSARPAILAVDRLTSIPPPNGSIYLKKSMKKQIKDTVNYSCLNLRVKKPCVTLIVGRAKKSGRPAEPCGTPLARRSSTRAGRAQSRCVSFLKTMFRAVEFVGVVYVTRCRNKKNRK